MIKKQIYFVMNKDRLIEAAQEGQMFIELNLWFIRFDELR